MGKLTSGGTEKATTVKAGTFAATGQSASFVSAKHRAFNVSLWGTFAATVALERSFDGGTTWLPMTALGNAIAFTGPCTEVFEEHEEAVLYRLNCTAYTSGTVSYRISQ